MLAVLRRLGGRGAREGAAALVALDAVRRAVVETLLHGERLALVSVLDEVLLGIRPRPAAAAALEVRAAAQ